MVFASRLDELRWQENNPQSQVLRLRLLAFPKYVTLEKGQSGDHIEVTLKDTQLGANLQDLPSIGLVKGAVVRSVDNDVSIQLLTSAPVTAEMSPTQDGYQLTLTRREGVSVVDGLPTVEDTVSSLDQLSFSRISGDRVQVNLGFSGAVEKPAVFKTVEPPRIVFDFPVSVNKTGKRLHRIDIASVDSVALVENDDRMRMVVNLRNPADYDLELTASDAILTIGANAVRVSSVADKKTQPDEQAFTRPKVFSDEDSKPGGHEITGVDFRRTPNGGGRVIVKLSDSEVAVDLKKSGDEVVAVFSDAALPAELEQRLDVIDFATPVSTIDTYTDGRQVKMIVTANDSFKQSSVQSGSTLIVDISPLTDTEIEADKVDEFGYKGEMLSLNFQRISVRAALQVIADFTGLNFVTSDAISGDLSLRLKDVPWDQALDVILQTKGLAMRQKGNVVWVAPAEEITAKEKQALAAQQEVGELEPLVSELIRVSYGRAEEVANMLKSVKAVETGVTQSAFGSVSVSEIKTEENSLLSSRGSVTVDPRTNSLLIQDTATKLREIKKLITQLDIPVRQVQIETRIVTANEDFSKNIGARLGFTRVVPQAGFPRSSGVNLGGVISSGTIENTNLIRTEGFAEVSDNALSVNLPAGSIGADSAASYAFTLAKLGSGFLNLLDLEISALHAEGNGRVLANPKILTTDKRSASIEQGQERLTTFGSAFGTSASQGQRAVLSLTVLPQITPDDKVILDVDITNDAFVAANVDTVNTRRINTQALLENGETVVIGGIYTQEESQSVSKVPFLGDLPGLGALFRKRTKRDNRSELLIFLTPRIIDPALAIQ